MDIHYFKGIKNWRVDCKEAPIVKVSGRNGTGKTSFVDAIQWCLFGKNSTGESVFGIKTLDEDGMVIPNVEHSVELSIVLNGATQTVKRVYVEKQVKRRGRETSEIEHKTEYYINGEMFTKTDFDAWIAAIAPKETFYLVSNPAYFLGLDWKLQRGLLQELVGDVDYSALNGKYADVVSKIKEHQDIEGYKKHLTYNIKLIKEKLLTIPARIDELRQNMPEAKDWEALQREGDALNAEGENLRVKIESLRNTGSRAVANNLLRDKIEFQRKRVDEMVTGARNVATAKAREYEDELRKARQDVYSAQRAVDDMAAKRKSCETLLARSRETLTMIEDEVKKFRLDWVANEKSVFAMNKDELFCPTCGREYDEEKCLEMVAKARENFAANKAARKAELLRLADEIKRRKSEAEESIRIYEASAAEGNGELDDNLKKCKAVLAEVEAKEMPTSDMLLAQNPNYKDACDRIKEYEAELTAEKAVADNSEEIASLTRELQEHKAKADEITRALGMKCIIETTNNRITELTDEEVSLNRQLAVLYAADDSVRDYEQAMNDMLEGEVNTHFKNIRFRLFDTLNDGTKKPWCTATIGGVEYGDANRAAQINAGLEICEVFAKHKDIIAPIVVDNAEAINAVADTEGQQIRTYVTNGELQAEPTWT